MSCAPRCRRVTALLVALLFSRSACADVRLVLASDRDATPLTRRLTAEASEIGLVLVPAKLRADETPRGLSDRERAAGVLHVVSVEKVELSVPLPNDGLARFETVRGRTESDEA